MTLGKCIRTFTGGSNQSGIIEELDNHQREYNKAKTRDTKQFIEERIVEVEKELNTKNTQGFYHPKSWD